MKEIPNESMVLDVDLSKADIDFPIFPAGLYRASIAGFKQEDNKDKSGKNLIAFFRVEQEMTTVSGAVRAPGTVVFRKYCPLQAKQSNPDWDWTANFAEIKQAALGHHTGPFNTEEVLGKEVILRITLDKTDKGDQNSIARVINVAEVK